MTVVCANRREIVHLFTKCHRVSDYIVCLFNRYKKETLKPIFLLMFPFEINFILFNYFLLIKKIGIYHFFIFLSTLKNM